MDEDDKNEAAAALVRELLGSVGLRSHAQSPAEPEERISRRAAVSAEVAFAKVPRVDRAANARRMGQLRATMNEEIAEFLSRQYGVPAIHLSAFDIRDDIIALLPANVVTAYGVVPANIAGDTLIVATDDPTNLALFDAISHFTGFDVEAVVTSSPEIDQAIARYYP